jgi:hypothetical protein
MHAGIVFEIWDYLMGCGFSEGKKRRQTDMAAEYMAFQYY